MSYPSTNAWLNQTKNPSCTDPTEERFSFKETGYDACSVYLYDASRRVHIRIAFYKKKIYYRDTNSPERELYDIKDAKNLEQRPDGSLPSVAVSHA